MNVLIDILNPDNDEKSELERGEDCGAEKTASTLAADFRRRLRLQVVNINGDIVDLY